MAFNIADLFEHTVDAVPDRLALVVGDDRLTFAEVEERSNRLAHHPRRAGGGPGATTSASTGRTPSTGWWP